MYLAELINGTGFVLDDKEFNKRRVWINGLDNPAHIECLMENGIICFIPESLWQYAEEEDNGNKQET